MALSYRQRLAVVGGGIAGTSATRELLRTGREVTLFEASDAVGGRARSWHRCELTPTVGINLWFTNGYERMHERIAEFGLALDEMTNNVIVVHDGEAAEVRSDSIKTLLKYPHISAVDRLRLLTATLREVCRRDLDLFEPGKLAKYDDGSNAADWASRVTSARARENLLRPEIESFWLWPLERVSAAHAMAMQAHVVGAKFYVFREGMEKLAEAMSVGAVVRTDAKVVGLRMAADRVVVTWEDATGSHEEEFDGVVVATTASQADALTRSLPANIVAPSVRRFLQTQEYEPALSVCYLVDRVSMPSAAHIVPTGPGPHGVKTIITFPRRLERAERTREVELAFVYPGREETRRLINAPDEQVFAETRRLVLQLWPDFPQDAENYVIARRPEGMPLPAPGRYRMSAAVDTLQRGPVVFAGDYFCSPITEAALRSGMRAAAALVATADDSDKAQPAALVGT